MLRFDDSIIRKIIENGMITEDSPVNKATREIFELNLQEQIANGISAGIKAGFLAIWNCIKDFLLSSSYAVALLGIAILILLHVVGYKKGTKYIGVLTLFHVFVQFLLG